MSPEFSVKVPSLRAFWLRLLSPELAGVLLWWSASYVGLLAPSARTEWLCVRCEPRAVISQSRSPQRESMFSTLAIPLPAALHLHGPRNHLQFLATTWLPGVSKTQVSVMQEPVKGTAELLECPPGDCLPLVLLIMQWYITCVCIWWEGERAGHTGHPALTGRLKVFAATSHPLPRISALVPLQPFFFFNASLILMNFTRTSSVGIELFKSLIDIIFKCSECRLYEYIEKVKKN